MHGAGGHRTPSLGVNTTPESLTALARGAQESIGRSVAVVDAAMADIAESNARIEAMEAAVLRVARGNRCRGGRPRKHSSGN